MPGSGGFGKKAIEAQFGIDEHIATVNHYEKELEAIRKRK